MIDKSILKDLEAESIGGSIAYQLNPLIVETRGYQNSVELGVLSSQQLFGTQGFAGKIAYLRFTVGSC